MAFSDLLDWSTIAIVLHFTKIDRLPGLVNRTDVEVSTRVAGPATGYDGVRLRTLASRATADFVHASACAI